MTTLGPLTGCVTPHDRTYVCAVHDPLITVGTKSEAQFILRKSQGSAFTFLMRRYLCLSFCSKNKARICANNRTEWLSEGKPQSRISCRHSGCLFSLPFSVSVVPLVSLTAPVSIVSDQWLKAGFGHEHLYFSTFLFCPRDPPRGPPWSVSFSYAARESSQEKNMAEWPTIPFAFPSQQQEYVRPAGTPFEKKIDYFLFCKERSPRDVLFSEWSCEYGCLLFGWGCFAG